MYPTLIGLLFTVKHFVFCFHSVSLILFRHTLCPAGHTCDCGTPQWSVGNCVAFSYSVLINFFPLLHVSALLCDGFLLYNLHCTSLTYVHDSLYIPQVFMQCLPNIICVMKMNVVYMIQHLCTIASFCYFCVHCPIYVQHHLCFCSDDQRLNFAAVVFIPPLHLQ